MTQIVLDQPAFANLDAHFGLEETIGVAAFVLGAVERGIGMGEKRVTVRRVVGAKRDADRGRNPGLRRIVGCAQRFQDRFGQPAGGGGVCHLRHQHGELVAAEPRHHLPLAEHRGDAGGNHLQHLVAGRMPEQIVDLLEIVEVETEHREAGALGQCSDLLVDPRIEMAAVGKLCQRVVMRQEIDMPLGVLARLQVANRDDLLRPSGKHDRPQDQFDRAHRAVEMAQLGFDRPVGTGQQLDARRLVRKQLGERAARELGGRHPDEGRKAGVDGDDRLSVANQQSLDGGIGEIAHPLAFEFRTPLIADVEHDACRRHRDDEEACNRHAYAEQSGGQGRLRNLDRGIGNDRHRAHRGEVMAADRQRQQQRAADLPLLFLAVQADRKRHRADAAAEHDRGEDEQRIPRDGAGDFECGHPGIVHRRDAEADDGAAQPRPMAPVRRQRYRKARAGQRNRDRQ